MRRYSVLNILNNLALLLWAQGDLAGARPLFERALAIAEKVLGLEHPSTATIREYLARFGRHSRRQAALLGGDLIKVAFETPGRLLDLCSALEAQIEYLDEPALAAIDASTSQSQ